MAIFGNQPRLDMRGPALAALTEDAASPSSVAVCAKGFVRTLVHPAVAASLYWNVLERGKHDLFLALVTGTDGIYTRSQTSELPDTVALQRALTFLRPRRTRFVLREATTMCAEPVTAQHAHAAVCAALVREQAEPAYTHMLLVRPDIVWTAPLNLISLAQRVSSSCSVIHTIDDTIALVPAAKLDFLAGFSSIMSKDSAWANATCTLCREVSETEEFTVSPYCIFDAIYNWNGSRLNNICMAANPLVYRGVGGLYHEPPALPDSCMLSSTDALVANLFLHSRCVPPRPTLHTMCAAQLRMRTSQ